MPRQVFRFVLVGALNTAFSFSVYSILLWFGVHFALANLLATLLGIIVSFRMHAHFVFGQTAWSLIWRYVGTWTLAYGANVALIALLISRGYGPYAAGAIAIAPTVVFSYLLQRGLVFRQSSQVQSPT